MTARWVAIPLIELARAAAWRVHVMLGVSQVGPEMDIRFAQRAKTFNTLGIVGGLGITGLLLRVAWGNWVHVSVLCLVLGVVGLLNVAITNRLLPRVGPAASEACRSALNLAASLVNAHLLGWPLASWLFLPFICVLLDGQNRAATRIRLAVVISIWNAFAFAAGAAAEVQLAFTGIALFCYAAASNRVAMVEDMLAERLEQNGQLQAAHEELKRLHVRALAQERLAGLGLLAAGVAHEINNPMSYVTSNLRGLLDDLGAAQGLSPELVEQRDQVLPETLDGVRRVNAIVSDLRRFANGERESPVSFDLRDEIEAAARIVRPQLKPKQKIRIDFPDSLQMSGLPRQVGQILLNLFVNSAQALPEEGEVVCTGRLEGTTVTIAVADNGSGMTKHTLSRLFEPFFTTKEIGKGTGLGLSVVHGIVRAQGGTIDVTSEPGVGSTFTVTLPTVAALDPAVRLPSP